MPHGLNVDFEGNVWVTDVGLHQAIKFDQQGNQLLVLGKRLEPGSDSAHLCKPTHVSLHVVHAQPDQQYGAFEAVLVTSKAQGSPYQSDHSTSTYWNSARHHIVLLMRHCTLLCLDQLPLRLI